MSGLCQWDRHQFHPERQKQSMVTISEMKIALAIWKKMKKKTKNTKKQKTESAGKCSTKYFTRVGIERGLKSNTWLEKEICWGLSASIKVSSSRRNQSNLRHVQVVEMRACECCSELIHRCKQRWERGSSSVHSPKAVSAVGNNCVIYAQLNEY